MVTGRCSNSGDRLKDDDGPVYSSSGPESSFLSLDPRGPLTLEKSCSQGGSDRELDTQNWGGFHSSQHALAEHFCTTPGTLGIISRSLSQCRIPLSLNPRFFLDSVNPSRRTRGKDELGSFVIEYTSAAGHRSGGKWVIEATEGDEKPKTNFSKLAEKRFLVLESFPDRSPEKPISRGMEPRRQGSALSSDGWSSSASDCSQGLLHLTWERGIPCFVFMVDGEKGEEVYAASMRKAASPEGRALDFMYMFHSYGSFQKSWRRPVADAVGLVGKMKVSSSSSYSPEARSRLTETEFVLFATNLEGAARELQKKNKGLLRSTYSSRLRKGGGRYLIEELSPSYLDHQLKLFDKSSRAAAAAADLVHQGIPPPNLELGAIIVRDRRREPLAGGWGLKFLEKPAAGSSEEEKVEEEIGGPPPRVVMVVPAGFHGGPATSTAGGPSSLTERLRSGGRCACGGWDLGCPLTVLTSRWSPSKVGEEYEGGNERGGPTLRVTGAKEGLYRVSFQGRRLSALQAFSAAVAIIHAHTPAMAKVILSPHI
ncbi:unnamed protein product [Spirodela intermedia]|uniref:Uncharacterized protein n=1 Tax=Spirodela intermedia TaxID=51605 RepID=A0A7I8K2E5_SPIIN|nr:unnamed protein product [Spirodela intermedia]